MAPAAGATLQEPPSPRSLVGNLVYSVYEDDYPRDMPTLEAFLFTRCRTKHELKNLLGLYTNMIVDPSFNKKELVSALEEHRLVIYIISTCQKKPTPYYTWFKYNIERWLQL